MNKEQRLSKRLGPSSSSHIEMDLSSQTFTFGTGRLPAGWRYVSRIPNRPCHH